ncbi:MAG: DUF1800 domain-containing protein [Opitutae bacterium]|nr:DUF1800 domain-containing protein [Opitutae bacterium]
MPEKLSTLSPAEAWQPLPARQWDEAAARHLFQRIGFSATPAETARALKDGLLPTLKRHFGQMPAFAKPKLIAELEADAPELFRRMNRGDPEQKRLAAQDARERSREALGDMTIRWLDQASRPELSPAEKWLLFLSDVWVVSIEKVKNSALIYQHQDLIRRFALGSAPNLAKAMSRSPAMIVYLDLQQSQREAPNENFARELFELFTLGEGHYTEADIKQAARAFTGYRQRAGEFIYNPRQHDSGRMTVFGHAGHYTGDDVIDLVFKQPAAGTFLPKEMVRFYLSDTPLPVAYTDALGAAWARGGYSLGGLAAAFFGSRAFFAEEFRGNYIKGPVQFYLGLLQDLDLRVAPLPRRVLGALRQMGQMPFDPPNVRGWVGGRAWINSATLAVRHQVINALLSPLNEDALNGDEQHALANARTEGVTHFTLGPEQLKPLALLPSAQAAQQLLARALPGRPAEPFGSQLEKFLARGGARPEAAVRAALSALLESPDYQLC